MPADTARLRYIDADHIQTGGCRLSGFAVLDEQDHAVGRLSGVMVDPANRRVEYLVVSRKGWLGNREKIYAFEAARLDRTRAALRVSVGDDGQHALHDFDPAAVRPFSDDDFLTALFA